MRILVQKVQKASVTIAAKEVASIGRGFLLFVGFTFGDDPGVVAKMADKVSKLRIFPDENGKTNLALDKVGGSVLSVSQFTLYGDVKEGNRPSFVRALQPDYAKSLFALFNNLLREAVPSLETGIFQADMEVSLVNEGPFTLWLDSGELYK